MANPSDEQLAEVDTALFFSRLNGSRLHAELKRILTDYAEQAKSDFLGYRGVDAAVLMAYRARWQAREDFMNWLEGEIESQIQRTEDIAAELNLDPDQLILRSLIEHE